MKEKNGLLKHSDTKSKKNKKIVVAVASVASGIAIAGTSIGLISATNKDSSYAISQQIDNNLPLNKLENSSDTQVAIAAKALAGMSPINIQHAVENDNQTVIANLKTLISYENRKIKGFDTKDIIINKNSVYVNNKTGQLELDPNYGYPNGPKTKVGLVTGTLSDAQVAASLTTNIYLDSLETATNPAVKTAATKLATYSAYTIVQLVNNPNYPGYGELHDHVLTWLHTLLNFLNNSNENYNPSKLHLTLEVGKASNLKNYQNLYVDSSSGYLTIVPTYGLANAATAAPLGTVYGTLSDSSVAATIDTKIFLSSYLNPTYANDKAKQAVYNAALLLSAMTAWNIHKVLNDYQSPQYLPVYNAVVTLLRQVNENRTANFNPEKIHVTLPTDTITNETATVSKDGVLTFSASYGAPYNLPSTNLNKYKFTEPNWIPCSQQGAIYNTYSGKQLAKSYQTQNGKQTSTPEINLGINVSQDATLSGLSPYAIANALNNPNAINHSDVWNALKPLIDKLNEDNPDNQYNPNLLTGAKATINANGQLVLTPIYNSTTLKTVNNKIIASLTPVEGLPAIVTGTYSDAQVAKKINVGDIDVSSDKTLQKMSPIAIKNAVDDVNNPNHTAVIKALKGLINAQNSSYPNYNPDKLQLPKGSVSFNPSTGKLNIHPSYGIPSNATPTQNIGTITGALSNTSVASQITTNLNLDQLKYNPNSEISTPASKLASMSPYEIETIINKGNVSSNPQYALISGDLKTLLDYVNEGNPNFNKAKLNVGTASISTKGQLEITPTYGFLTTSQNDVVTCKTGLVLGTLSDQTVANRIDSNINIKADEQSKDSQVSSAAKQLAKMTPIAIKNAVASGNKTVIKDIKTLINAQNSSKPSFNPAKLQLPPDSVSVDPNTGKLKITPYYGTSDDNSVKSNQTPGTLQGTYSDQEMANNLVDSIDLNKVIVTYTTSNPTVANDAKDLQKMSGYAIATAVDAELKAQVTNSSAPTPVINKILAILDVLNQDSSNPELSKNFNPKKLHLVFNSVSWANGILSLAPYYGLPFDLSPSLKPNVPTPGTITGMKTTQTVANSLSSNLNLTNLQIGTPSKVYQAAHNLSLNSPIYIQRALEGKLGTIIKNQISSDLSNLLDYINKDNPDFDPNALTVSASSLKYNYKTGVFNITPTYGYGKNVADIPTGTITGTLSNQKVADAISSTFNLDQMLKNNPNNSQVKTDVDILKQYSPIAIKNAIDNPSATNSQTIINALKGLINVNNSSKNEYNSLKLSLPPNSASVVNGQLQITPYYGSSQAVDPINKPVASNQTGIVTGLASDSSVAASVKVGDINVSSVPLLHKLSPIGIQRALDNPNNPNHKTVIQDLKNLINQKNTTNPNYNPDKLNIPSSSITINPKTGQVTIQPTYGSGNTPTGQSGTITGAASDSSVAENVVSTLDLKNYIYSTNANLRTAADYLAKMSAYQIASIINDGSSNSQFGLVTQYLKTLINSLSQNANNSNYNPNKLQILPNPNTKVNANGNLQLAPEYGFILSGQTLANCQIGIITGTLADSTVANSIKSNINIESGSPLSKLSPIAIKNIIDNPSNPNNGTVVKELKGLIDGLNNNTSNPNFNPNKLHLPPGSVSINPKTGKLEIKPFYGSGDNQKQWTQSSQTGTATGTLSDLDVANTIYDKIDLTTLLTTLPKDSSVLTAVKALAKLPAIRIQNTVNAELTSLKTNPNAPIPVIEEILAILNYLNADSTYNKESSNFNPSKLHLTVNSVTLLSDGTLQLHPYYGLPYDLSNSVPTPNTPIGSIIGTLSAGQVVGSLKDDLNLKQLSYNENPAVQAAAKTLAKMSPMHILNAFEGKLGPGPQSEVQKDLKILLDGINASNEDFNPNKLNLPSSALKYDHTTGQLTITPTYGIGNNAESLKLGHITNALSDQTVASQISSNFNIEALNKEIQENPNLTKAQKEKINEAATLLEGIAPITVVDAINNQDAANSNIINALKTLIVANNLSNQDINILKLSFASNSVSVNGNGQITVNPSYGVGLNQFSCPSGSISGFESDQDVAEKVVVGQINVANDKTLSGMSPLAIQKAVKEGNSSVIGALKQLIDAQNTNTPGFNKNKLQITPDSVSLNPNNGKLTINPSYGSSTNNTPVSQTGEIIGSASNDKVAETVDSNVNLDGPEQFSSVAAIKNAVLQLKKMSAWQIKTIIDDGNSNPMFADVSEWLKILICNNKKNLSNPNFNSQKLQILKGSAGINDKGNLTITPSYGFNFPNNQLVSCPQGVVLGTLSDQSVANSIDSNIDIKSGKLSELTPTGIVNAVKNSSNQNHDEVIKELKQLIDSLNNSQSNPNFNPNKLQITPDSVSVGPDGKLKIDPSYGPTKYPDTWKTSSQIGTATGTLADSSMAQNIITDINLDNVMGMITDHKNDVYQAASSLSKMSPVNILNSVNQEIKGLESNMNAPDPVINEILTILNFLNKQKSNPFASEFNPSKLHLTVNSVSMENGQLKLAAYYGLPFNLTNKNIPAPNTKTGTVLGTLSDSSVAATLSDTLDLQNLQINTTPAVAAAAKQLSGMSPIYIQRAFEGKINPVIQSQVANNLKTLLNYVNSTNQNFNVNKLHLPSDCLNINPTTGLFTITPTYGTEAASATALKPGEISGWLADNQVVNTIHATFNLNQFEANYSNDVSLLKKYAPIAIVNAINNPKVGDNSQIINALKALIIANNPTDYDLNPKKLKLEPNTASVASDGSINITVSYGLTEIYQANSAGTISGFKTDADVAKNVIVRQISVADNKTLSGMSPIAIQNAINNPNNKNHDLVIKVLKQKIAAENSNNPNFNVNKLQFPKNSVTVQPNGVLSINPSYGSPSNAVPVSQTGSIIGTKDNQSVANGITTSFNLKEYEYNADKAVASAAQALAKMTAYQIANILNNSNSLDYSTVVENIKTILNSINGSNQNYNPSKLQFLTNKVASLNAKNQLVISPQYGFVNTGNPLATCPPGTITGTATGAVIANQINSNIDMQNSPVLHNLTPTGIANAVNNPSNPEHDAVVKALKNLLKEKNETNPAINPDKIQIPVNSVSVNSNGQLEITPSYGNNGSDNTWVKSNKTGIATGAMSDDTMAEHIIAKIDLKTLASQYQNDSQFLSYITTLATISAYNLVNSVNSELKQLEVNPNANAPIITAILAILVKLNTSKTDNPNYYLDFNAKKLHLAFNSVTINSDGTITLTPYYGLPYKITNTPNVNPSGWITGTLSDAQVALKLKDTLELSLLENVSSNGGQVSQAAKMLAQLPPIYIINAFEGKYNATKPGLQNAVQESLKTLLDYLNQGDLDYNPEKMLLPSKCLKYDASNNQFTITPTYGSIKLKPGQIYNTLSSAIVAQQLTTSFNIPTIANSKEFRNNKVVQQLAETLENATPIAVQRSVNNPYQFGEATTIYNALRNIIIEVNSSNYYFNSAKLQLLPNSVVLDGDGQIQVSISYGSQNNLTTLNPGTISGLMTYKQFAPKVTLGIAKGQSLDISKISKLSALTKLSPIGIKRAIADNDTNIISALQNYINSENSYNFKYNPEKIVLTPQSIKINPSNGTVTLTPFYGQTDNNSPIESVTLTGYKSNSAVTLNINSNLDLSILQWSPNQTIADNAKTLLPYSAYALKNIINAGPSQDNPKYDLIIKALWTLITDQNSSNKNFNAAKYKIISANVNSSNGELELHSTYGFSSATAAKCPDGFVKGTLSDQVVANAIKPTLSIPSNTNPLSNLSPYAIANAINNLNNKNHDAVIKALKNVINAENDSNPNYNHNKLQLPVGSVTVNKTTGQLNITPYYGPSVSTKTKSVNPIVVSGTLSDSVVASHIINKIDLSSVIKQFSSMPKVVAAAQALEQMAAINVYNTYNNALKALEANPNLQESVVENLLIILRAINSASSQTVLKENFNPEKLHLTLNSLSFNKSTAELTVATYYGLPFTYQNAAMYQPNTTSGVITGTLDNKAVASKLDTNIDLKQLQIGTPYDVGQAASQLAKLSAIGIVRAFNGQINNSVETDTVHQYLKTILNYLNANSSNPVSANFNINKLHLPAGCLKLENGVLSITPTYGLPLNQAVNAPQGTIQGTLNDQSVANTIKLKFGIKTLAASIAANPNVDVNQKAKVAAAAKLLEDNSPIAITNAVNHPNSTNSDIISALKTLISANNLTNYDFNSSKLELPANSVTVNSNGELQVNPSYGTAVSNQTGSITQTLSDAAVAQGLNIDIDLTQVLKKAISENNHNIETIVQKLETMSAYKIMTLVSNELENANSQQSIINDLIAILNFNNAGNVQYNPNKMHLTASSLGIDYKKGQFTIKPYYGLPFSYANNQTGNITNKVGLISGVLSDETVANELNAPINLNSLLSSINLNVVNYAKDLMNMSPYAIEQAFNNSTTHKAIRIELEQIASAVYTNKQASTYNDNFNQSKIIAESVSINPTSGALEIQYNYGFDLPGKNYKCPLVTINNTLSDAQVAKNINASNISVKNTSLSAMSPYAVQNAVNKGDQTVINVLKNLIANKYDQKSSPDYNPNFNPSKLQFPAGSAVVGPNGNLVVSPMYGPTLTNNIPTAQPGVVVPGTLPDSEVIVGLHLDIKISDAANNTSYGSYIQGIARELKWMSPYHLLNNIKSEFQYLGINKNLSLPDVNGLLGILQKMNESNPNFNPNKLHLTTTSVTFNQATGQLNITPYYGLPFTYNMSPNTATGTISQLLSDQYVASYSNSALDLNKIKNAGVSSNVYNAVIGLQKYTPYGLYNLFTSKNPKWQTDKNDVISWLKTLINYNNTINNSSIGSDFNLVKLHLPEGCMSFKNGVLKITPTYGLPNTTGNTYPITGTGQGIITGLLSDSSVASSVDNNINVTSDNVLNALSPIAIKNAVDNPNNKNHKEVINALVNQVVSASNDPNLNPSKLKFNANSLTINPTTGQLEISPLYGTAETNQGTVIGTLSDSAVASNLNLTLDLSLIKQAAATISNSDYRNQIIDAVNNLMQMSDIHIINSVTKELNNPRLKQTTVNNILLLLGFVNKGKLNYNPEKMNLTFGSLHIDYTTGQLVINPYYGLPFTAVDQNGNFKTSGTIIYNLSDENVANTLNQPLNLYSLKESTNTTVANDAQSLMQWSPYAIYNEFNNEKTKSGLQEIFKLFAKEIYTNPLSPNYNPNFNWKKMTANKVEIGSNGQLEVYFNYGFNLEGKQYPCPAVELEGTLSNAAVAKTISTQGITIPSSSSLSTMSPYNIINQVNSGNDNVINELENLIIQKYHDSSSTNYNKNFNPNKLKITSNSVSINPVTGQLMVTAFYGLTPKTQVPTTTKEPITGTLPDSTVKEWISNTFSLTTIQTEIQNPANLTPAQKLLLPDVEQALDNFTYWSPYHLVQSVDEQLKPLMLNPDLTQLAVKYLWALIAFHNVTINPNINPNKIFIATNSVSVNKTNGYLNLACYYGLPFSYTGSQANTKAGEVTGFVSDAVIASQENSNLNLQSLIKGGIPAPVYNAAYNLSQYSGYGIYTILHSTDPSLQTQKNDILGWLNTVYTYNAQNNIDGAQGGVNFNPNKLSFPLNDVNYSNGQLTIIPHYGYGTTYPYGNLGTGIFTGTLNNNQLANDVNNNVNVIDNSTLKTMSPIAIVNAINQNNSTVINQLKQLIIQNSPNSVNLEISNLTFPSGSVSVNANGQLQIQPDYSGVATKLGIVTGTYSDAEVASGLKTSITIPSTSQFAKMSAYHLSQIWNGANTETREKLVKELTNLLVQINSSNPNFNKDKLSLSIGALSINTENGNLQITPTYGISDNATNCKQGIVSGILSYKDVKISDSLNLANLQGSLNNTVSGFANSLAAKSAYQISEDFKTGVDKQTDIDAFLGLLLNVNETSSLNFNPNFIKVINATLNHSDGTLNLEISYNPTAVKTPRIINVNVTNTLANSIVASRIIIPETIPSGSVLSQYTPIGIQRRVNKGDSTVIKALLNLIKSANQKTIGFDESALSISQQNGISINSNGQIVIHPSYGYGNNLSLANSNDIPTTGTLSDSGFVNQNSLSLDINVKEYLTSSEQVEIGGKKYSVSAAANAFNTVAPINIYNQIVNELQHPYLPQTAITNYKVLLAAVNSQNKNFNANKIILDISHIQINDQGQLIIVPSYGVSTVEQPTYFDTNNSHVGKGIITGMLAYKDVTLSNLNLNLQTLYNETLTSDPQVNAMVKLLQSTQSVWLANNLNHLNDQVLNAIRIVCQYANRTNPNFYPEAITNISGAWVSHSTNVAFSLTYGFGKDSKRWDTPIISGTLTSKINSIQAAISQGINIANAKNYTPYSLLIYSNWNKVLPSIKNQLNNLINKLNYTYPISNFSVNRSELSLTSTSLPTSFDLNLGVNGFSTQPNIVSFTTSASGFTSQQAFMNIITQEVSQYVQEHGIWVNGNVVTNLGASHYLWLPNYYGDQKGNYSSSYLNPSNALGLYPQYRIFTTNWRTKLSTVPATAAEAQKQINNNAQDTALKGISNYYGFENEMLSPGFITITSKDPSKGTVDYHNLQYVSFNGADIDLDLNFNNLVNTANSQAVSINNSSEWQTQVNNVDLKQQIMKFIQITSANIDIYKYYPSENQTLSNLMKSNHMSVPTPDQPSEGDYVQDFQNWVPYREFYVATGSGIPTLLGYRLISDKQEFNYECPEYTFGGQPVVYANGFNYWTSNGQVSITNINSISFGPNVKIEQGKQKIRWNNGNGGGWEYNTAVSNSNVQFIGKRAFRYITGLGGDTPGKNAVIAIPSSVKTIGVAAFEGIRQYQNGAYITNNNGYQISHYGSNSTSVNFIGGGSNLSYIGPYAFNSSVNSVLINNQSYTENKSYPRNYQYQYANFSSIAPWETNSDILKEVTIASPVNLLVNTLWCNWSGTLEVSSPNVYNWAFTKQAFWQRGLINFYYNTPHNGIYYTTEGWKNGNYNKENIAFPIIGVPASDA